MKRALKLRRQLRLAADCVRLAVDLESRAAEIRALRGDLDLLEAERDGALAQVARLTRKNSRRVERLRA